MFPQAIEGERPQVISWRQLWNTQFTNLAQFLSNMTTYQTDSRSSTPSFFDRGLPSKPLPSIPEREEKSTQMLPPLKHRRLLAGDVAPDPIRKPRRPISWSETQIRMLQKEVQALRQDVIDHKRQVAEKDRIIATQQHQINKYIQRESKQDDLLQRFTDKIQASLADFRDKRSWRDSSTSSIYDSSDNMLDDIITIFQEI